MSKDDFPRLIPTRTCWCGCGNEAGLGKFFAQGHDKIAEGALLAAEYDRSVAQLLHAHGYGPGRSVTASAIESGHWSNCPESDCWYAGTPESIKNHLAKRSKGAARNE